MVSSTNNAQTVHLLELFYLDRKPLGRPSSESSTAAGQEKGENSPARDTPYAVNVRNQIRSARPSHGEERRENTHK